MDEQLREKDLIINGRVFPKTQLLEIVRFSSIKDGVVHELYYYCDTCYIPRSGTGGIATAVRHPLYLSRNR